MTTEGIVRPDEPDRGKGKVGIGQVVELLGPLVEEGLQCQLGVTSGPPSIVRVMVRDLTPALIARIRARLSPLDAKIVIVEDPTALQGLG